MEPNKNTSVFLKHYDKSNWKKVRLGDVSTMFSGGTPSVDNKSFYNNGNIPFIRSGEIAETKTELYITEEALNNSSAKLVQRGDLLLALYGATSGKVAISNIKGAINQAILCIRSQMFLPAFLYHFLTYNQTYIISTFLQGGQGNLSAEIIKGLYVDVPPASEQSKISNILSQIDSHIENIERIISKQESIKKTTEFLLLQPKDNWNKVKLGEVVEYYKGNGLSKEKLSSKGTYPCILYGELFTRYTEIINSVYSKTVFMEGVASCDGDVLMPGSTTTCGEDLAKASAITQDNVLLGGDVIILRPNKKRLDGRFLAYLISQYKKELIKYTQGITIIHLQGNKMLDMVISIPDLETQRSTINHIVAIDKELEHLRSELDKYRNIKKGLMDYFFG